MLTETVCRPGAAISEHGVEHAVLRWPSRMAVALPGLVITCTGCGWTEGAGAAFRSVSAGGAVLGVAAGSVLAAGSAAGAFDSAFCAVASASPVWGLAVSSAAFSGLGLPPSGLAAGIAVAVWPAAVPGCSPLFSAV